MCMIYQLPFYLTSSNIFRSGKSYSNMYETEPRFNEPFKFDELLDLTNLFRQPKLKIYLKFTSI